MKRKWLIGGAVAAAGVGLYLALARPGDPQLTAALVGRWIATDPDNPTLHRVEAGVAREEIDIRKDGTLAYTLQFKPGAEPGHSAHLTGEPTADTIATRPAGSRPADAPAGAVASNTQTTRWGWKIMKGRLLLKDLGEGSTQEWLKPLKISISSSSLSIDRRKYPTKEFTRLNTADSRVTAHPERLY